MWCEQLSLLLGKNWLWTDDSVRQFGRLAERQDKEDAGPPPQPPPPQSAVDPRHLEHSVFAHARTCADDRRPWLHPRVTQRFRTRYSIFYFFFFFNRIRGLKQSIGVSGQSYKSKRHLEDRVQHWWSSGVYTQLLGLQEVTDIGQFPFLFTSASIFQCPEKKNKKTRNQSRLSGTSEALSQ